MDADAILTALHAAGLPIIGVTIPDPADPATWTFQPATLTPAQVAQAVDLLTALFAPAPVPAPPTVPDPTIPEPTGATVDQVIAWEADKLKIPNDQAQAEVAAYPPKYVPPPV